jgi:hypothetical protein
VISTAAWLRPVGIVVVAALLVGCGGSQDEGTGEGPALPEVVFAGDSVMGQVAAAATSAFDPTVVDASFVLTPTIAADARVLDVWRERVEEQAPDVLVVMVGIWETTIVGDRFVRPGWPSSYVEQLLPFLELMEEVGTGVVWLSYPPVDFPDNRPMTAQIEAMNRVYATLPEHSPAVEHLDAGAQVASAEGTSVPTLVGADGVERVVRLEDQHLCPEGARLIAEPVVELVGQQLGVEPSAGWQDGPWREGELFDQPASCQGAGGGGDASAD